MGKEEYIMELLTNGYDSPEIVSDDGSIQPRALVLVNVNVLVNANANANWNANANANAIANVNANV